MSQMFEPRPPFPATHRVPLADSHTMRMIDDVLGERVPQGTPAAQRVPEAGRAALRVMSSALGRTKRH
jgi:hypothetical protein